MPEKISCTLSLDPALGFAARQTAAELMAASAETFLLQVAQISPVSQVDEVSAHLKHWPSWSARPWILAGRFQPGQKQPAYAGPWIEDCRGSAYQTQVTALLNEFDWALFAYFTSFQDQIMVFVTRQAERCVQRLPVFPFAGSLQTLIGPPDLRHFHNASFADTGQETAKVWQLAQTHHQAPPLLLCYLEACNTAAERQTFEALCQPLKPMGTPFVSTPDGEFRLYQARDLASCCALWDPGWVVAMLAAETNLERLMQLVQQSFGSLDLIRQGSQLGAWAYARIYGGGPDEYHGLFHSPSADLTHSLWEQLGDSQISRF